MQPMRKVILYIAVNLDGYIADSKGTVDWLCGQDGTIELEDTFTPFFNGVDTVIMGRKTYHQIATELLPEQWPYEKAVTYVLTHHPDADDTKNIRFRNMDTIRLVEELKQQPGRDIWICGGAKTAWPLIANNQIDIYHIAVIPVLLGNGIKLFDSNGQKVNLILLKSVQIEKGLINRIGLGARHRCTEDIVYPFRHRCIKHHVGRKKFNPIAFHNFHLFENRVSTFQSQRLSFLSQGHNTAIIRRKHTNGFVLQSGMKHLLHRTKEIVAIY